MVTATVWWSTAHWSTTAFWILAKPLHRRSMLSKSMSYTEKCNPCSWHWLTEWPQFFSTITSNRMLHNQHFNWMNNLGYKVLPHLPYSPDLSPTNYHFFKHLNNFFSGKTIPQPAVGRNYFQEVHRLSKNRFLHMNKQTFLTGKNVLTIMVPILINKDVFKPSYSYNDLKFKVWNHNYFCTNLLFNHKEEWSTNTCELWKHYAQLKKQITKDYIQVIRTHLLWNVHNRRDKINSCLGGGNAVTDEWVERLFRFLKE